MPLGAADELLRDVLEVPFSGWDFSVLGDRIVVEPPPWPFEQLVDDEVVHATSMLDMGTGGGEWLSRRRRAARTVATEGWAPNVPIASARLVPLGAVVVQDEGAVDNVEQASGRPRGRLPFRAAAFDLVVNRHEAFVASEGSSGPRGSSLGRAATQALDEMVPNVASGRQPVDRRARDELPPSRRSDS